MNKILIYYSLTNNGDEVANYYKKNNVEVRKVNVKKELPKSMFFKIMTGGFKALIGYREKLIDFDNNIDKYDEVIIASPIWFDRISSPIRTVLNKLNLDNKKVSFVLYSASGAANKATEFINKNYKNAKIIILKEPKSNKNELEKLKKNTK